MSQKYYAFYYNYSPDGPRLTMVRLNNFSSLQWYIRVINDMRYLTPYKTGFVLDDFVQLAARVGVVLSMSKAGWARPWRLGGEEY